jgi:hypothetical protein
MSFKGFLRQSTAATIMLGPFLDTGDGNTYEGGMTLEDTEIWLSKNGGAFANPNNTDNAAVDASVAAYYTKAISTTDTNTCGILRVVAKDSAALICDDTYQVVEEAVFDALYAAAASGFGTAQTGDAYAVVAHADYGLAKLVRSTTPANTLTVDANHLVAVPDTQKVDVNTLKTQAVTCGAGVTVGVYVGGTGAAAIEVTAQDILTDTGTTLDALIKDVPTVAEFEARSLPSADYTVVADLGVVQTADHTASIADIPTVAEFNARSLPSADYVVVGDTIAGVTLCGTCTTNTDMRGTDNAALASVCTEARLSELDSGTAGKAAHQVDIIQTDTTTDIPVLIAALNNISVADIIAGITDGSYDLQEMTRIMFAALAGKASGGGTTTNKFRNSADTKDRITATVDAIGNRTAIILDAT